MPLLSRLLGLGLLALALLPAGCSGPPNSAFVYSPYRSMARPAPDKALVYFFREQSLLCDTNFLIHDGFDQIGGLPCRAYFFAQLEPGHHLFWGQADLRGEAAFLLEPGRTYYVRVGAQRNELGYVRNPTFALVFERVGREAVFSSSHVELR